ncbi:hypothetical protein JCM19037_981 [Geomicrobium sp. JCM 19037]|uniref:ArsR/SmtB family transcription factor n=1 Tax=Geomicrobium sp. JCM 19037 TaxID=1460634 RepID=UPI00045F2EF3|nr:hypothetical protein [Geomicrobium sp. JCM 19037]GAK02726.1 hypothetical protein JCM19037_981 [Geomicrobium sp. JCM 19037]
MSEERTGDELLAFFEALANRHRLRMVAMLYEDRKYVSQLARELGMSVPSSTCTSIVLRKRKL